MSKSKGSSVDVAPDGSVPNWVRPSGCSMARVDHRHDSLAVRLNSRVRGGPVTDSAIVGRFLYLVG
jgi:hypothetical protein